MDYEKKYKEALERVRELAESNPSDEGIQKYVQDAFPELKKSEDERIMEALVDIIEHFLFWENKGLTKEKVLGWLERQGEQKPADDIERKYNPCYNMSFEEAQEYISNRGFDIPWTDCDVFVDFRYVTQTVANILRWADDNPRQKPAWSEEDEKKLLCICAWIKDYPRIADFKEEMYAVANNYIDWLLKKLREE